MGYLDSEKLLLWRQKNLIAITEKIALRSIDHFNIQEERYPANHAQWTLDLNLKTIFLGKRGYCLERGELRNYFVKLK